MSERKQTGMIFSAESVRAIQKGIKTQTRRVVTPQPEPGPVGPHGTPGWVWPSSKCHSMVDVETDMRCLGPYGSKRDLLWVREVFSVDALTVYPCPPAWYRADCGAYDDPAKTTEHDRDCDAPRGGIGRADCYMCALGGAKFRWKSPMFMPRKLSRITLEISDVRVQRLQEITEEDARAEGCRGVHGATGQMIPGPPLTARDAYAQRWDAINGKRRRREFIPLGEPGYGNQRTVADDSVLWEANPFVWALSFREVHP